MIIHYLIIFLLLTISMGAYIKWAKKYGLIDKPNERSSHERPTVRGGGIIFPVAVLCWGLLFDHSAWPLIISIILIGGIGFLDDRYSLHQLPRLAVQSISVFILLYFVEAFELPYLFIGVGFILITGWLNAFNFMDGINGISVLYAASVMAGVYVYRESVTHVPDSFMFATGIALVVFAFVNLKKKAIAFAGDVGSLSLGLLIAYFIADLIITTGRWEFILFLGVYGVDSVMTIMHRLKRGENIFEAHRSHLYQYLANELKISHVTVSFLYAALQFVIILGFLFIPLQIAWIYTIATLVVLVGIYESATYLMTQKMKIH
ncbi:MAG: hypothetical protein WDZ29_00245 [Balneolaceae bacterium]